MTPFAVGTPFGASPPVMGSSMPILISIVPAAGEPAGVPDGAAPVPVGAAVGEAGLQALATKTTPAPSTLRVLSLMNEPPLTKFLLTSQRPDTGWARSRGASDRG